MTQQPYYPPQQPVQPAPQQVYPPQYPQAPAQQYPPQPAYAAPAPQAYVQPQQYGQPPQPPAQPLAEGSLDAFYNQPSAPSGPSISWTDAQGTPKPIGTQYGGIVARDVTNSDVQQQTDFQTQAPLFYKDGRPKFAMKVPLKVQPSQEHPEGEATWYVKGQARDELTRAMAEAGVSGAPKAGDAIVVTLVQRRPSGRGMNPANVVQVQYQPANGRQDAQQQAGTAAPSPAAVPTSQPAQPVQQPQVQQEAPPAWAQPAPVPQQIPLAQPVQQYQQPQVQQQAAPQGQPALQPPADMTPEQQEFMARLTAGAQQGTPAA